VLRLGAAGLGTGVVGTATAGPDRSTGESRTDPHTRVTLRALVEAVIPETPALAEQRGPEHEAGGVTVGLDDYLVTYLNDLLALGAPGLGGGPDARLAEAIAAALDEAALELVARGTTEPAPPGGPFAGLPRRDRLRAVSLFDPKKCDTSGLPGPFAEADAGLVAHLAVGFTELLYYSEWEGYEDITAPPGERSFDEDGVTAWRQTGYPGPANGYAALRGYLRLDGNTDGVDLVGSQGSFAENDYATDDYTDPYPEQETTDVACLPEDGGRTPPESPLPGGERDGL